MRYRPVLPPVYPWVNSLGIDAEGDAGRKHAARDVIDVEDLGGVVVVVSSWPVVSMK